MKDLLINLPWIVPERHKLQRKQNYNLLLEKVIRGATWRRNQSACRDCANHTSVGSHPSAPFMALHPQLSDVVIVAQLHNNGKWWALNEKARGWKHWCSSFDVKVVSSVICSLCFHMLFRRHGKLRAYNTVRMLRSRRSFGSLVYFKCICKKM